MFWMKVLSNGKAASENWSSKPEIVRKNFSSRSSRSSKIYKRITSENLSRFTKSTS